MAPKSIQNHPKKIGFSTVIRTVKNCSRPLPRTGRITERSAIQLSAKIHRKVRRIPYHQIHINLGYRS